jgi:hypothetical protein
MSRDAVTIVSGLPRSGTSLLMQMLHAGGLPVLTDQVRAPDASNPRGYFEYEPVKRLRTDSSWLANARGHAVKIIHLLLPQLPVAGAWSYRIIFMHRPLDEVLASQRVMLEQAGKPSADAAILRRAFTSQLAQVETWLAAHPDIQVLRIDYHQVLRSPREMAENVRAFLGHDLSVERMVRAVDPALYRQRSEKAAE